MAAVRSIRSGGRASRAESLTNTGPGPGGSEAASHGVVPLERPRITPGIPPVPTRQLSNMSDGNFGDLTPCA